MSRVVNVLAGVAVAAGVAVGGHAFDVPAVVAAAVTGVPSVPAAAEVTVAPSSKVRSFVVVQGPNAPVKNAATQLPAAPLVTGSPVTSCAATVRQRAVETALATVPAYSSVVVDGRQSQGDCAVIRRFQQRFGIEPAAGQADATTEDVARRISDSLTTEAQQQCDARAGVSACVDLTRQTAWVVRDGEIIVGPTIVRTGFRGHATPAGTYRINKRELREWSDPYEVWLPYWQRFIGGIGFHETTTYIHDGTRGSHGCVNLLHSDAVAMWDALQSGAVVHTFGRRPGT
ncbi:hypothetical protein BG844_28170 [Couchioplanes caeruleus subsp. caeruleus]|uniref:L,D-TPase catalytic domain-containing protein n=1 Tax=Couchioplanes caeruleus subsp. caeruleus TaxID=56427 RepID=A0A1K0GPM2_9ACTN|nr:hypothetical protein BG844_28170 [Couchioplanes caeruleus subsp. caeruleus]